MDKPTLGAVILAKLGKPKPVEDKPELGEDKSASDMTFDSAIDDLFDAIQSNDKDAFKEAFAHAVENCPDADYDGPDEEK